MIDKPPAIDNILDNFPNSWTKSIKFPGKFLVSSQITVDFHTARGLSAAVGVITHVYL